MSETKKDNQNNKKAFANCSEKNETDTCKVSDKNKALEAEINHLKNLNTQLEKQLVEKQKKIDSLQDDINAINKDFVDKIQQKSNQANERLNQEIKAFQQKQEKEMAEFKKYCVADKLNEIIDIIGKFDQAISFKSDDPKINNFLIGFQMFKTQFKTALEDLNIHEVDVKVGDEFDHNTMEAIGQCTDNPTQPNNHVEKIVDKGYKIYDRLIKPARIIVSKK